MAALRGVVKLCYWFPDAALIARRFADRTAKRAHETAPRKDAPDLPKLLAYLAPKVGAPADPERVELAQFSHGQPETPRGNRNGAFESGRSRTCR